MTGGNKHLRWIALLMIGLFLVPPLASAADGPADWRPTYDLVLRWVNFLILAGVLFKFGKRPVADFLKGEKLQIQVELEKLEEEKVRKLERVAEAEAAMAESGERFQQLTERIVADGERRKREIVEGAQAESRQMLEEAKRRVEGRIANARARIRTELVDSALHLALERLPGLVTEEDNRRRNAHFLDRIQEG